MIGCCMVCLLVSRPFYCSLVVGLGVFCVAHLVSALVVIVRCSTEEGYRLPSLASSKFRKLGFNSIIMSTKFIVHLPLASGEM
jgi:hypothetical protein